VASSLDGFGRPALEKMTELDAWAATALMSPGINIGNTLENTSTWETGWGNPPITKEYVDSLARLGFKSVRLPVAWDTYAVEDRIQPDKFRRVGEVVDWITAAGMVCVLNIHWDGGWIDSGSQEKFPDTYATFSREAERKFRSYWEQISTFFAGKNERLIFEALNEETNFSNAGSIKDAYATLTRVNQLFVDTVRKTGGNNSKRLLLVAGYNTDIAKTCSSDYKLPKDTIPGRLFISVHYYTPYQFSGLTEDADWGKMMPTWGTPDDSKQLDELFDKMNGFCTRNDTPAVIGEFGVVASKDPASRMRWLSAVFKASISRSMVPVLWDTGHEVNRHRPYAASPELLQVMRNLPPMPAPPASPAPATARPVDFHDWAPTPPMGWNSWDCLATTVTEEQTKAQASFMAEKLKAHGWQYIVLDAQWFEPGAKNHEYRRDAVLTMDGFGRLQPAPNRFPSSADGSGFRALAAHVHSLGLKFGIHLMRGIPRQAVEQNLPILGTDLHAPDIADKVHICQWNSDNFGIDMSKPGAQDYYDSVFALIASWGVDYVKVDDLSRPYFQNLPEVEAVRRAIDKTGRPIVLSLSPGPTHIGAAGHVAAHANLWRISDDFWDRWLSLRDQFVRLATWSQFRKLRAWPDADMLPLGTLVLGTRSTRFTADEQYTLMTLWSIARSPLMYGGDMTKTDDFTLSLLTNDEVLAVNQRSSDNRQLSAHDGLVAWSAKDPANGDSYLAVFNARDRVTLDEANARQPAAIITDAPDSAAVIDTDLHGARKLFLVAMPKSRKISSYLTRDFSEPEGFPPVLWQNPRFVFAKGRERPLGAFPWSHADSQWDSAAFRKGKPRASAELRAQVPAVIEYAIPAGAERFKATVRIEKQESGGTGPVRVLTVLGTEANEDTRPGLPVEVMLAKLGITGEVSIRDLWTHTELGSAKETFSPVVPFHGARLFRLSKRPADAAPTTGRRP
jgi:alpha-galactosidase